MDYKSNSLDDMIKRDKKLGRGGRPNNNNNQVSGNQRVNQAPLPGRNRGGASNVQRARNQPRIKQTTNGITKGRNQNQQQQQRNNQVQQSQQQRQGQNNQNQRNNNQRRRLMTNQPVNQQSMQNQGKQSGQTGRQTLQNLRQNRRPLGRRAQTGNQTQARNNPQQRKRMPQGAPAQTMQGKNKQMNTNNNQNQQRQQVNQGQNQNPQLSRTLSVVQGTLAERKLRVRGIDARVVSQADLQKLFGKCGPLINASFDTNEYGSYLGTATVIYSRSSSANRAIKEYHMAQIDQRPMKVSFASQQQVQNNAPVQNQNKNAQQQPQRANNMPARRQTNNRIAKSAQGRTLNVMGQRRNARNQRANK